MRKKEIGLFTLIAFSCGFALGKLQQAHECRTLLKEAEQINAESAKLNAESRENIRNCQMEKEA